MDEVIETTNEAAEDVNVFIQYLQDHIPNLISFAIEIVLALIFFFLGRIAIKWIRKLTRKMLERSNVDKGVETFVLTVDKMYKQDGDSVLTAQQNYQMKCLIVKKLLIISL